ncbi:MAG: amino acid ABC transporter permease [Lachnospiraceae bacterium]|nr:amino acid ABC transporter permease [Lachnospiraceae bacterium]MCD7841067.1 amino acid ABC transporter permease [Lachnospiraceae bacterium]
MYHFSMSYFADAFLPIIECMRVTLFVTFASFASAFVLAILLAVIAMTKNRVIQAVLKVWLSLFRGTPLLAQLFLFCYGIFPYMPGINQLSLTTQAVLCLALSYSAYMSETIRGAILSVDKGQMEACITCGMTSIQGYIHVVLPQAFRLAVPSLMNNFIECFKGSSLCSMVGVVDMMLRAKMLANKTYRFIEVYLCVLILYWALNMIFVAVQKMIEHKANAIY